MNNLMNKMGNYMLRIVRMMMTIGMRKMKMMVKMMMMMVMSSMVMNNHLDTIQMLMMCIMMKVHHML